MAAIVLLALTLPLAGVLWSADRMLKTQRTRAAAAPAEGGALRAALEEIADRRLAPAALGGPVIEMVVGDFDLELTRLTGLARGCGGHAVTTFRNEGEVRVAVQVPEERAKEFVAEFAPAEERRPPAGPVVLVVLRKPSASK